MQSQMSSASWRRGSTSPGRPASAFRSRNSVGVRCNVSPPTVTTHLVLSTLSAPTLWIWAHLLQRGLRIGRAPNLPDTVAPLSQRIGQHGCEGRIILDKQNVRVALFRSTHAIATISSAAAVPAASVSGGGHDPNKRIRKREDVRTKLE